MLTFHGWRPAVVANFLYARPHQLPDPSISTKNAFSNLFSSLARRLLQTITTAFGDAVGLAQFPDDRLSVIIAARFALFPRASRSCVTCSNRLELARNSSFNSRKKRQSLNFHVLKFRGEKSTYSKKKSGTGKNRTTHVTTPSQR